MQRDRRAVFYMLFISEIILFLIRVTIFEIIFLFNIHSNWLITLRILCPLVYWIIYDFLYFSLWTKANATLSLNMVQFCPCPVPLNCNRPAKLPTTVWTSSVCVLNKITSPRGPSLPRPPRIQISLTFKKVTDGNTLGWKEPSLC